MRYLQAEGGLLPYQGNCLLDAIWRKYFFLLTRPVLARMIRLNL
jgi:hypothetical protein